MLFRFTLNAKDLSIIQTLDKIASANTSVIGLQQILIEVDNVVRLTASNSEARITAVIPVVDIEGGGKILVEPKRLGALARALGEMPMTITYDQDVNKIEVATPNGEYNLSAYDAANYPQAVNATGKQYEVAAEDIARGIKATIFAAASDTDYHSQLQGVQLAFGVSALTFTATNTHFLAQLSFTDIASEKTAAVVIPTKYAQMMAAICDGIEGKVTLTIAEKTLTLNSESINFTTALVSGTYPDIERVFPKEVKAEAVVDSASLRTTLSRVGIMANDRVPSIRIDVDTNGQMRVSTADKDTQQDASEIVYGSANNTIGMNFAYKVLANAISAFSTEIIMQATDATHPALFIPAEDTGRTRYRVLVMPMRS